jgi:hypothetical protein
MHQTTVRFGTDLWQALEREAARVGVSVAHYVRDAALARVAYSQGLADAQAGSAFAWGTARTPLEQGVLEQLDSSAAVKAQGQIARARAQRARAEAGEIRRRTRTKDAA